MLTNCPVVSRSPPFLSDHPPDPSRFEIRPSLQKNLHRTSQDPRSHPRHPRTGTRSCRSNGCHLHRVQQQGNARSRPGLRTGCQHRRRGRREYVQPETEPYCRWWGGRCEDGNKGQEEELQDTVIQRPTFSRVMKNGFCDVDGCILIAIVISVFFLACSFPPRSHSPPATRRLSPHHRAIEVVLRFSETLPLTPREAQKLSGEIRSKNV